MQRIFTLVLCLGLLVTGACTKAGPEATAREFMETYYRQADLTRAGALSTGLAKEKIAQEASLGGGQAVTEQKAQRKVEFKTQGAPQYSNLQGEERAEVIFSLSVLLGQHPPMERAVKLSLQRSGDGWRVTNFVETGA